MTEKTNHPKCDLVMEHHNILGGLEKGMETVEKQTTELFRIVHTIEKNSNDNRVSLAEIREKIDNGITGALDSIKRSLEAKPIEENGALKDLKENSWVVTLLAMSVKKVIITAFCGIIGFAIVVAAMNTAFWAKAKHTGFGEKPGQQQSIFQNQLDGYRSHTLSDGRIVFMANDPNKPAWVLDPTTKMWKQCPQWRTEEGLFGK